MSQTAKLGDTSVESLNQLAEDFVERVNRGEQPDIEEYVARYPQAAEPVRQVLEALQAVRMLTADSDSTGDAEGVSHRVSGHLGDYRIVREVGRGGMGVVYEAEQVSLGRRVALKVLPFAAVLDAKQLQRFKNEAHAAAQLHHTNIVPVFSVGCERGVHYYAMQYIEGSTLGDVIHGLRQLESPETPDQPPATAQRAGPFGPTSNANAPRSVGPEPGPSEREGRPTSDADDVESRSAGPPSPAESPVPSDGPDSAAAQLPDQPSTTQGSSAALDAIAPERSTKSPAFFRSVANLGVQAAEALEHAHELGVVHRDIKPSNLLLDARGNVWITDFGLARLESDASLTLTGDVLGTVRYMSPEQAAGRTLLLDHRTDIYSLGVTLYELLTLKPALDGRDRQELLRKIADEDPRLPRRLNAAIPADLETIVLKATAKEPQRRYASAKALTEDLQRFLLDKPIRAKRPTLIERTAKWSRRHRQLVASAAIVLVVAVVGLSIGIVLLAQKQAEVLRQRTETAQQRDEANAQRQRAEANLGLALQALDEIYMEVAERLPGQETPIGEADRKLLQKALGFYERFAEENRTAAEAQYQTARAYKRAGDIHRHLGRYENAAEAYRQALEIMRTLSVRFPEEPAYRLNLAKTHYYLGVVLLDASRPQEAREPLEQALAIGRELLQESPNDRGYRQSLADTHNSQAALLMHTGRFEKAEQSLQQAQTLREKLAAESPDNADYQAALADSWHDLGYLLLQRGRYADAEPYFRQALEVQQRLTAKYPENVQGRYKLAMMHHNLGYILWQTERLDEAEQAYREAIRIRAQLAAQFPNVPKYRVYLARTQNNLGLLLKDMGNFEEAEQAYRQALNIHQKQVEESPGIAEYQCNLGAALHNLAGILEARGHYVEACALYERAIDHQRTALKANPRGPTYRRFLRNHYNALAFLLVTCPTAELRDGPRAVELAKKALELFPDDADVWNSLGIAHYRIGDWQAAIDAQEKSLELKPGIGSYSYFFLAMAHWQLGNKEQAREWYDRAVDWMEEKEPDDEQLQRFRAEADELMGPKPEPGPKGP